MKFFTGVLTGEVVLQKVIRWPKIHAYPRVAERFAERAVFPMIINAIDGTYIPIPGTRDFRDSYFCRKGITETSPYKSDPQIST